MKIGNTDIVDCKIGDTQVNFIYIGNTLIWQKSAAYDVDFQAKLDRATYLSGLTGATGYNLPKGQFLTAENELYLNLKNPSRIPGLTSSSLWDKTEDMFIHATDGGFNYATLRGKSPSATASTLRNSPGLTAGNGFTGNGTSSDISYGVPGGLYTLNSAFMISVVRKWGTNSDSIAMNGTANTGTDNSLWIRFNTSNRAYINNRAVSAILTSGAKADKTIIGLTRTSSTDIAYGETQNVSATASTVLYTPGAATSNLIPNDGMFSLSLRGALSFSTGTIAANFYGSGLTEQEFKDYMIIIKKYLLAIGW